MEVEMDDALNMDGQENTGIVDEIVDENPSSAMEEIKKNIKSNDIVPLDKIESLEVAQANVSQGELIKSYAALQEAAKVVPAVFFEPKVKEKEIPFSEQIGIILEKAPPQVWYVAVPCCVLLIAVLAFSPAFLQLVMVFGACSVVIYFLWTWQVNTKTKAEQSEVTNLQMVAQNMHTISDDTAKSLAACGKSMHAETLSTIRDVAKIRASVQSEQIVAAERMHEKETLADVQKKKLGEDGLIERNRVINATRLEISNIETEAQKKIETLKAEAEKLSKQVELQIKNGEYQNAQELKKMETKTQQEIAKVENDTRLRTTSMQMDMEKVKIAAAKDVDIEKERGAVERGRLDAEARMRQAEAASNAEIRKAEAAANARIAEAQRKKGCIIA